MTFNLFVLVIRRQDVSKYVRKTTSQQDLLRLTYCEQSTNVGEKLSLLLTYLHAMLDRYQCRTALEHERSMSKTSTTTTTTTTTTDKSYRPAPLRRHVMSETDVQELLSAL